MTKFAPWQPLPRAPIVDRETFILDQCRGKRTLEVGCAAWPFTLELFNKGELLFQKLEKICSLIAGVDIASEGIDLLRSRGMMHLFTADASEIGEIIDSLGWTPELIIAGEILEHVDTPGPLLCEFALQMASYSTLLITVPNAFSLKGFLRVILGYEKVNSDHVAYYSYISMRQLLSRANLELIDMVFYKARCNNLIERVLNIVLAPFLIWRPYLSDGLIFCCRQSRLPSIQ